MLTLKLNLINVIPHTFRALGDMVYLIQDMAQPQHTRNDPHAGCHTAADVIAGEESGFELYIDTRAKDNNLSYGAYPLIPQFSDPLRFFTTRHVDGNVMARKGMADYSHRSRS